MTMRNMVEEFAPLDLLLITFPKYKIKGQSKYFYDTSDEDADFGEFANHMADKENEGSNNQTTEGTTNTN